MKKLKKAPKFRVKAVGGPWNGKELHLSVGNTLPFKVQEFFGRYVLKHETDKLARWEDVR